MREFFARRVNGRWWVDGARANAIEVMSFEGEVPPGDWAGYVTMHEGDVVEILDRSGNPIAREVSSER